MRTCAAAIGLVAALAAPALQARQATDVKQALYNMANSLGMLRTVQELDSVMTVEFWGSGSMREVGPKDVGPPVQIKSYYAQIAYDFPGMRVDTTRASDGQRDIQVVSGKFAWNEIEKIGGGLEPGWGSAVPAMGTVTDRLLRLWTTPFGVYKAAVAAGEKTKATLENGAVVLTFPLTNSATPTPTANLVVGELNGTLVNVTLDANHRPARVEVRYRDRAMITTYSNYGDLNEKDLQADIYFPARIAQTVDGQTVLDLTIEKTNTYNPYVIMPVPENVEKMAAR